MFLIKNTIKLRPLQVACKHIQQVTCIHCVHLYDKNYTERSFTIMYPKTVNKRNDLLLKDI